MTDAQDTCNAIENATLATDGVESCVVEIASTHEDGSAKTVKVTFKGTAKPSNVYARLNFKANVRPENCTLLVYKDKR